MGRKLKGAHVGLLGAEASRPFYLSRGLWIQACGTLFFLLCVEPSPLPFIPRR